MNQQNSWFEKMIAAGVLALTAQRLWSIFWQHQRDTRSGITAKPRDDERVTQDSMDSFPASDPPSWSPTVAAP